MLKPLEEGLHDESCGYRKKNLWWSVLYLLGLRKGTNSPISLLSNSPNSCCCFASTNFNQKLEGKGAYVRQSQEICFLRQGVQQKRAESYSERTKAEEPAQRSTIVTPCSWMRKQTQRSDVTWVWSGDTWEVEIEFGWISRSFLLTAAPQHLLWFPVLVSFQDFSEHLTWLFYCFCYSLNPSLKAREIQDACWASVKLW